MTSPSAERSFSIVIPTFQRRDVVCMAVEALAHLQYSGSIELIVVIDGSTDGTAEALAAIKCPFPLWIVEQPNGGAAHARNRGAAAATNDILLFLDDDMICDPRLVEAHSAMHRAGADAVIGDMPIDRRSPVWFLTRQMKEWAIWDRKGLAVTPFEIFCGQVSVRRSAFETLGGFDTAFTAGSSFANEDIDFGVRLLERFDVRHTSRAISHHLYVVSPRDYMHRAAHVARGDLRFAGKHPLLSRELFRRRGSAKRATRLLYRPLSRLPFFPRILSEVAIVAAELGQNSSYHSSRRLARLFSAAYSISYWATVRRVGASVKSTYSTDP